MSWLVSDVMTRKVVVVGPDTPFKTCVELLRKHGISALPVVGMDRRVLGVVSEADLLAKEEERAAKRGLRVKNRKATASTAASLMTSPAVTISPSATIPEAARLMHRKRVKRLPVIDEQGRLVGIASRADLLKTFTRSDSSIQQDITGDVLRKSLFIDPGSLEIDVSKGLVRLSGQLETKSLAELTVGMVKRVEGVVGVESHLTWRLDDTHMRVEPPPGALQLSAQERSGE